MLVHRLRWTNQQPQPLKRRSVIMRVLLVVCVCIALASAARKPRPQTKAPRPSTPEGELKQTLELLNKKNKALVNTIGAIGRQLILQQLSIEEHIRATGDSGIKQVRLGGKDSGGTKSYHSPSYSGTRICAIHDHANNIRTIGMGEFTAVLNGVEFRTRHNDYGLRMPHRTSIEYHAMEDIPFPAVPPAVLAKKTVMGQTDEMREWFKAWSTNNIKLRDYRPYFRPVLCYLEGAWTKSSKNIDEPFASDRHFVDAKTWFDLQEKIRFTSYTGRKSSLENYSYLPTKVMEMINGTLPSIAQWNYRIACHPLKNDLPLDRLRVIDDLAPRMAAKRTIKSHILSRAARFQVNIYDSGIWRERAAGRNFLDEMMEQVPGKDNYVGNSTDDAFSRLAEKLDRKNPGLVNVAYYHRWFKTLGKDAMGSSIQHRGYSDANIFMAMTSQPRVAAMSAKSCDKVRGQRKKVCKTFSQRWTYAIPLEIIYLTPLARWNPYNLAYMGQAKSTAARVVQAGGRNGELNPEKAYKGTHSKVYFQTPVEFFTGSLKEKDPAATSGGSVGVLDRNGAVREVMASGTRRMLPEIKGLGQLRTRYPIMAAYSEGDAVWKELSAIKDIVMEQSRYLHLYRSLPVAASQKQAAISANATTSDIDIDTGYSTYQPHKHTMRLADYELAELHKKGYLHSLTNEAGGHRHNIKIQYYMRRRKPYYRIMKCDGQRKCWDGHPRTLIRVD